MHSTCSIHKPLPQASGNRTDLEISREACYSEEGGVVGKRQERRGGGFVSGLERRRLLSIVAGRVQSYC